MNALASVFSTDNPGLPALWLAQIWLHLGWGTVLAWLTVRVGTWVGLQMRVVGGLAAVMLVGAWLPGPYAPTHWLGLAFQGPSAMAVLLCAADLAQRLPGGARAPEVGSGSNMPWLVAGVSLGWVLLLDTFALLPVSLYAWGFGAAAPALVLLLALLPWVLHGGPVRRYPVSVLVVVALGVYGVLRLPSGNVWDALLDPWLWLWLHACGVHALVAGRRCGA